MPGARPDQDAGAPPPRRLFVYTRKLRFDPRITRILALAGWQVATGRPDPGDHVGVWGASPLAHRGERMARAHDAPLLRIEDAFLRSLFPGRAGEPPLGLLIDSRGAHFDPARPSDLEEILAHDPLDDAGLLTEARAQMARLQRAHLTKYAATRTDLPLPEPGYVLVVDQTRGDASVTASGADRLRFLEMLTHAREAHPGQRILIRSHPETAQGHRPGHFEAGDLAPNIRFHDDPVSPWQLLEGAVAVYTVSSQLGFEAILAGHRPQVFGQPFYAGWGLTEDAFPIDRRQRRLTRAQLFAGAMMLYPVWFDPYRDRRGRLSDAIDAFEAEARAWREDRAGWVGRGMRLWKRGALQGFFGSHRRMVFAEGEAEARAEKDQRRVMVWAGKAREDEPAVRVEDGFLRSRGLGAELVPPLSLALDDLGIYYDPTRPSRLERLIAESPRLSAAELERAGRLITFLTARGLSKYNLAGALPPLPEGHRILVPGQVEDDASILKGAGEIRSNAALLARVRAENPGARILWKPHPDVTAGLRLGAVREPLAYADATLEGTDIAAALGAVEALWTITSLTGFEALLRGVKVTTLGTPFYAGWGLTRDLGRVPARRQGVHGVTLEGLVHAALIAYPRYRDPVTGRPCPVEVVAERLASGALPRPGAFNRSLSKLQGLLASRASLWR
ncbi:capsular polysaccharide biosynthesis protein [Roseivivax sp. GX 12232]|uniref:capsular polysaccharide biosynthesis protein n=1 Tax=Roseivivax sp. GX 12232 TaxID=2900547 RepID=UPI001E2EC060|nr:capsular polysaccharide biosynthesis protein [Roseivivax sp. GX 12232]MCE0506854.1 capsular polysaccharide biosynthesis protein [Roseivivax sp. GX 12232]